MTPPAIEISNLSKFYKAFRALNQISFSVSDGEFFGFLGPNGAGKTTTIHAMTGLVNYQHGDIRIFGHDVVKEYRKSRSLIGFVPQEFNFDPYLNVEQILVFEAGYFGVPHRDASRRAEALLDRFDLLSHRKLDYRKLSGGMKRRLLLARALIHEPRVLILDEPTAGVDVELRIKLWDFLRELNQKGITIFLTTHYIEEAEKLCKRIGVINHGQIIAMDSTQSLIETMGRRSMEIRLDKSFDEKPGFLNAFDVEWTEKQDTFRCKKDDPKFRDLLKSIHQNHVGVLHIEIKRSTLEEVFIEMTTGENGGTDHFLDDIPIQKEQE